MYSEPSPLASEAWSNVCWSISAAPQGPPAMRVPGVVCSGEDEVTGGEEDTVGDDTEDDDTEDDAGATPADDGGLWCELASTAMPALAPAMTTTAAAARTGAKARLRPRLPRRGPGSRPRG